MANTFFGFNARLNDHAERLGSSPEDIEGLEAEDEYDALNDETFGTLGSETELEDWEAQHEQLAEIAESSRYITDIAWNEQEEKLADISKCSKRSNDIEALLDHLGINETETESIKQNESVWSYDNTLKNGEKQPEDSKENSVDNSVKLLPQNDSRQHNSVPAAGAKAPRVGGLLFVGSPPVAGQAPPPLSAALPKLRTVEELERMLINQAKPAAPVNNQRNNNQLPAHPAPVQSSQQPPAQHPPFPHGYREVPPTRYPPGFQPMVLQPSGVPPHLWHHQQHPHHHQHLPPQQHGSPGMVRIMRPSQPRLSAHLVQTGAGLPPPPPGFFYPTFRPTQFSHFNFPPPPAVNMPGNMAAANRNQAYGNKQGRNHEAYRARSEQPSEPKDEYAGLMNNREKQWLLNIQLLQVNTETPYFDDFYYTVFKERQAKNKENLPDTRNNQRYPNNRYQQHGRGDGNHHHHHHHHHGNHRNMGQDNRQEATQNPLNKKVYTPLQFENSLGKLQFGSVTAPRKIIDMDIITLEKDSENTNSSRDSRKTKQLLLELEALYALILKAEDLQNPFAVSSIKKLKEMKEKQRLREMDLATSQEQKQEVLKLLQQESVAPVETQAELLGKIVHALLQDDKLTSFIGIRKGKMLLLRVLPQLSLDTYSSQVLEIWIKLLLSIPLVGRRDTIGDNILPKFHSLFKRFINATELNQILEIISNLLEMIKLENSRSTPLSYHSKPPLYFILSNKFGISAISSVLTRVNSLLEDATEKQFSDWTNFINCLVDTLSLVGSAVAVPIEPLTEEVLNRHTDKYTNLSAEKKQLLQKIFIDIN